MSIGGISVHIRILTRYSYGYALVYIKSGKLFQPSMETTMQNYNYPEKHKFLLQVMCEVKSVITQHIRIGALAERVEFVRLPNDEISRFASVQSTSIA